MSDQATQQTTLVCDGDVCTLQPIEKADTEPTNTETVAKTQTLSTDKTAASPSEDHKEESVGPQEEDHTAEDDRDVDIDEEDAEEEDAEMLPTQEELEMFKNAFLGKFLEAFQGSLESDPEDSDYDPEADPEEEDEEEDEEDFEEEDVTGDAEDETDAVDDITAALNEMKVAETTIDTEVQEQEEEEEDVQIPLNQVHEEATRLIVKGFVDGLGREPTAEELESALSKVMATLGMEGQGDEEEEEEADEEYVPSSQEVLQAQAEEAAALAEFLDQKEEEESENVEEDAEEEEVEEVDGDEWRQALDAVRALGMQRGQDILERVATQHTEETGMPMDEAQMKAALDAVKHTFGLDAAPKNEEEATLDDIEEGDEEVDDMEISEEEFEKELAEAMAHIRALGRHDGAKFARLVSDTFEELTGREPELQDVTNIYGRIKTKFAEEDREDLLEDLARQLPSAQEVAEVELDEEEAEEEPTTVTTIPQEPLKKPIAFYSPLGAKKTKSRTQAQVVEQLTSEVQWTAADEERMTRKLMERAVKRFSNTHGREPSTEERHAILRFFDLDLPVYDFEAMDENADPNVKSQEQAAAYDSAEDSDYDPKQDETADPHADLMADLEFQNLAKAEAKQQADEEVMIDID